MCSHVERCPRIRIGLALALSGAPRCRIIRLPSMDYATCSVRERQVTHGPGGRILTNCNVWSPDSRRIVFDTRSDPAGDRFDGDHILTVDADTLACHTIFTARDHAKCGVATFNPVRNQVAFILGPRHPTADWSYGSARRQGVLVDLEHPEEVTNLDARDIVPPYTPGALRGGTHVHVFSPDGAWVSFTYNDHVLESAPAASGAEPDQRNVGVAAPFGPVRVPLRHERNHDGAFFSVLVSQTVPNPAPGSDQIARAFEEGWIGVEGYVRPDGTRQRRALAFQGEVRSNGGNPHSEVFVLDIPENPTVPGTSGPLEGTPLIRPRPPRGTVQRRLTHTDGSRYPGLAGPRHWLRSSPDGSLIAFLMRDERGVVQIFGVSPCGGPPRQITRGTDCIQSAFTWSPDGAVIAHVMDGCVCVSHVRDGWTRRLTHKGTDRETPRPEACVFSPDGRRIAYVRRVRDGGAEANQIFVLDLS